MQSSLPKIKSEPIMKKLRKKSRINTQGYLKIKWKL